MALRKSPPRGISSAVACVVIVVGLMLVAVCFTVLGTTPTLVALGLPVASAAALYAIRRPLVMLTAMVVIEVTNLAGVVAERSPLPIAQASLALGMLTVAVSLRDPVMRGRLNRGTVLCVALVGCYLVTQVLAMLGSQSIDVSITALDEAAVSCLFLCVIFLLTQFTGKPWAVASAVVTPLAVISALCLVSQVFFGGAVSFGGFAQVTEASGELITTLRYGGPLPDSNFWGRHLVVALPLAGALTVRSVRSGRHRAAFGWAAAVLALLAGVYLTQSRGTMIATAVAILVWVLASGPVARRRGLMSLPLVALVVLVPGIGNRMLALTAEVSDAEAHHGVDPSVLGRMNAQEMAWAMFRDRPMFGFGPDVFESSIPRYAGTVTTAVLHPTDAPHNLYAQLAADSGLVGLLGWMVFVGGFILFLAVRVSRLTVAPTGSGRVLGAAVLAGLVAWSLASVFLHLAYFRTFVILLALAGALASAAGPERNRSQDKSGSLRQEVLATVFGTAAAAAVLAVCTTTAHTVTQKVTILPTEHADWEEAYALDIKSREALLPTYAAMIAADTPRLAATADPVRGVITISVAGTDDAIARADLNSGMSSARKHLADFGADSWYTMIPVGAAELRSGSKRTTTATVAGVAVGTLVAGCTALTVRRRPVDQSVSGSASAASEHTVGVRA